MQTKSLVSFALAFALLVQPVLAAPGQVVSDPGSYTYYIEQIEKAQKQIELITKQVETLGGIKTATDDVKRQIYTVSDAFMNAMTDLMKAQEKLGNAVVNSPKTVDKLFSLDRDSITTNSSDGGVFYRDTAEMLDDVYTRFGVMGGATWLHLNDDRLRRNINKDITKLAYRKLIYDQDQFKERQVDRIKRTSEILQKMMNDKEPSMIQTQINTAALLQELIQIQIEMLELQKSVAVAYGYSNYKAVDFEKTKKNLEQYKDEDPGRKTTFYQSNKPKTTHFDKLKKNDNLDARFGY